MTSVLVYLLTHNYYGKDPNFNAMLKKSDIFLFIWSQIYRDYLFGRRKHNEVTSNKYGDQD